jgi:glc operon protein GlcG
LTTTYRMQVITLGSALALTNRALAHGDEIGVKFSVTVVDPSMNLVSFAKADGATPHSIDSSRRKANTSASTRRPSGWMGDDLAIALPLATDLKLTNIIGGSPLLVDDVVVGAIGIAGGTPAQDAQIAAAVAAGMPTL